MRYTWIKVNPEGFPYATFLMSGAPRGPIASGWALVEVESVNPGCPCGICQGVV